ncbi:MAG TPA: TetR/AcrR family transcriptional regulator C-terminal domain-containing protein [Gaiellaceae bacterium]
MATSARKPLSRERILARALALADEQGLEAITMRRLGEDLGYEAMSLYRHVENKDDVINGMLDLVLAEWEPPAPGPDWRAAVRASAITVHDALRRHPWAASVMLDARHARPARMAYGERLLACLRENGFSAERTYAVYHLIDGHIFGFSRWEIAHAWLPADIEARLPQLIAAIDWSAAPYFAEHRDQHFTDGPHRDANAFELGLDLILAGLSPDG